MRTIVLLLLVMTVFLGGMQVGVGLGKNGEDVSSILRKAAFGAPRDEECGPSHYGEMRTVDGVMTLCAPR